MSDKIELHGWTDLIIPTEALFDLSSRAYKLYGYTVWRARDNSSAFPGQERISEDLSIADESWSLPTVKRAFAECVTKSWMHRERRLGTSSITHVFKSKADCEQFKATVGSQAIRQRIAGDPTTDRGRSEKDYKDSNNNEDIKELAPKPSKPSKERDPNLDHPAFKLWDSFRDSGVNKLAASAVQRQAIVDTIGTIDANGEAWADVITHWLMKGYRLINVSGLLEWYTSWKAIGFAAGREPWAYQGNGNGQPKSDVSRNKGQATPEQIEQHKRFLEQRRQAQGESRGNQE